MGNAESGCGGGSGDEEDVETESPGFAEESPASAATGGGAGGGGGGGGSGSARSGRGSNNVPVSTGGPPNPGVLLEQVKLREAAARISESGVAIQSVLGGNEGVLVRWLEDRLNRGEESVNVEQFCEMLESRDAPRDECEEVSGHLSLTHVVPPYKPFTSCGRAHS